MKEINWTGGRIEVTRGSCSGWSIEHRINDGRVFGVDWAKTKTDALRLARIHSQNRRAKLLVEA